MNILFWRKPKKDPKVIKFNFEQSKELRRLLDEFYAQPLNQNHMAKYKFWEKVAEFAPETDKGMWEVDTSYRMTIAVKEYC